MEKIAPKDRVPLLGAAIHKARKAQGLSQERLAAMIGTSQNYVSALERGECNVKYIRLGRLPMPSESTPPSLWGNAFCQRICASDGLLRSRAIGVRHVVVRRAC